MLVQSRLFLAFYSCRCISRAIPARHYHNGAEMCYGEDWHRHSPWMLSGYFWPCKQWVILKIVPKVKIKIGVVEPDLITFQRCICSRMVCFMFKDPALLLGCFGVGDELRPGCRSRRWCKDSVQDSLQHLLCLTANAVIAVCWMYNALNGGYHDTELLDNIRAREVRVWNMVAIAELL